MSETPAKRARTEDVKECRACLMKVYDDACCVDIFRGWHPAWSGMGVSIAEDLAKLTNIVINVSDPLPKSICKRCCFKLQDAVKFTMSVQNNDTVLRERYKDSVDENLLWPKPIQVDKNITSNELNEMTVEVKQEVLTEDEYESNELTNESYNELGEPSLDIKIEPEEITPAITVEVNGPYALQPEALDAKENGVIESLEEGLLDDVKKEPMSEDEAEPPSDMPKDCMLCFKTFHTVEGLKAHVIAVHSYDSVTSVRVDRANVCTTCNRSFATRTDLFVHETCHSQFACYVCDMKFPTFNLLTKHRSIQCTKTSVLPRLKTLEDVRRPVYFIMDKKKSADSPTGTEKIPEHKQSSQTIDTIETNLASVDTDQVIEKLGHNKTKEELKESCNEQNARMNEVEQLLEEIHRETEKIPEKSDIGKTKSSSDVTVDTEISKESSQSNDFVKMTNDMDGKLNSQIANGSEKQDNTKIHQEVSDVTMTADCNSCDDVQNKNSDESQVKDKNLESNIKTEDKAQSKEGIANTTHEIQSEESEDVNKIKENELAASLKIEDAIVEDKTDSNSSEVTSNTLSKENVQEVTTVSTESTRVNEDSPKSAVIEDIQPKSAESCANDDAETNSVHIDENDKNIENFEPKLPLENSKANLSEDMEMQIKKHSMDDAMDTDDLESDIKSIHESDTLS